MTPEDPHDEGCICPKCETHPFGSCGGPRCHCQCPPFCTEDHSERVTQQRGQIERVRAAFPHTDWPHIKKPPYLAAGACLRCKIEAALEGK